MINMNIEKVSVGTESTDHPGCIVGTNLPPIVRRNVQYMAWQADMEYSHFFMIDMSSFGPKVIIFGVPSVSFL